MMRDKEESTILAGVSCQLKCGTSTNVNVDEISCTFSNIPFCQRIRPKLISHI